MEPNISLVASLIGDTARASMLTALMAGKALTATELALEAEITTQTASSHLKKLVDGNLLVVRKQGRHKYFQLSGLEVANIIESLLNLSSHLNRSNIVTGPGDPGLRKARICYDHLAGEIGVALYDALIDQALIQEVHDKATLSKDGQLFFSALGVDFNNPRKNSRPLCKTCLDWSERRNHLAGVLGQWVLEDIFAKNWAIKEPDSRVILFSSSGAKQLSLQYGITLG